MLRLNLLGPPSLQRDGVAVPLPIRKSMALLLLVARNPQPLPRGRIAALLWPGLDDATARRNLRRELARLREAGAGDAVVVDGDRLGAASTLVCDATSFEAALAEHRAEDALALWRGPPADGFALGDAPAFDDWLATERERLLEHRRGALRAAAATAEADGDALAALRHVESLITDDALQEQHHRDAMRLLLSLGRREAALAQFERCRELLRHELDLEPMEDTAELAALIRGSAGGLGDRVAAGRPGQTHDDRAAPVGRAAPKTLDGPPVRLPNPLPFVGRNADIAVMEAAWAAGKTIVLEGEAGVGKTRLACDFAAAHGPYALVRCRSGDAEVPYASFARAMRALLGDSAALPPELPGWMATEAARLIPALGAAAAPLRTDEERSRFFEACAGVWHALSADDFDAVVIDDWHLADAASRSLFAFVMRRRSEAGSRGAREILTLRPELGDAAVEALAALIGATSAVRLRLQSLSGAEVFDLVQRLSRADQPTHFAQRLERATAGNPFFLVETLRHLVEGELLTEDAGGGWQTPFDASTEDYRELPVPASVQEAVRARAERLAPATRRVLEAAALAAEPFSPRLLAPACALSELEAVLAIEDAVAAQLLREHEQGGFAFAHDLVQQSLVAALSADRARLVHRRLALGGEAAGAAPAAIAAHHEASGEPARAVAHRIAAGDEARRLRELPEAMAQWRKALADGPTAAQAVALRKRLCQAAFERTDPATVIEQAAALACLLDTGELDAAERIDVAVARSVALARGGNSAEALAVLDALPDEASGQPRADACIARAMACQELGRIEQALQAVQTALALPGLSDGERAELLDFAFSCEFNAGRTAAALGHAEAALVLARRLGDASGIARSHHQRGIVLLSTDDTVGAEGELLAAAQKAGQIGLVHLQRIALYNLTCVYASLSRPAQALEAAERGWHLAPPLQASDFRVMYRLAMVDAHFALGDLGAAWDAAAPALDEAQQIDDPRVHIGAVSCTLELLGLIGEVALARRLIAAVDRAATRELKAAADEMWVALAQFELRHGDVGDAARALAELAESGPTVEPRVRRREAQARAGLALAEGDAATALALLPTDGAPAMNGEMRTRGLALRVAAEARLGRIDDNTAAAALVNLAAATDHAVAALELRAALAEAACAGVAGASMAAHAELAQQVEALAATLRDHEPQRTAFREAWR